MGSGLLVSSSAVLKTATLPVGNRSLSALYGGTGTLFPSVSSTVIQTVIATPSSPFIAAAGGPVGVGAGPFALAMGDFNGDGRADLSVANGLDNTITVLLGNGSGGFTPASGGPLATGTAPVALVVGDFNGDGKPDIAAANYGDDTVTVLLGNGNGGFAAAPGRPFATGSFPVAVVVGDFNRDGKADLAIRKQRHQQRDRIAWERQWRLHPRDWQPGRGCLESYCIGCRRLQ